MIAIDTHLHYYDFYDAGLFMRSLVRNLEVSAPGAEKAGIVLDRAGMRGYEILADKVQALPEAETSVEKLCFHYSDSDGSAVVYRGVQCACIEGFEVLGLFCAQSLEDRMPAMTAVQQITAAGGIAVVAWAPGKWMFKRRKLVSNLLGEIEAGSVLLGDTALRPSFWGEPSLMREFRDGGGRIVCGSDPLPFPGQERVAGSYASLINAESGSAAGVKDALAGEGKSPASVGMRVGAFDFACRMLKNRLSK